MDFEQKYQKDPGMNRVKMVKSFRRISVREMFMRGHSRSEEILALNCLFLFTFNGLLLFSAFPFWSTHVCRWTVCSSCGSINLHSPMLVRDGLHVKLYNVAAFKKNIILLFLKKKYWRKCRLDYLLCFSEIQIVSAGFWTQQVVSGFVHIQSYTF